MKVVHEWLQEYVGPTIPPIEALEELFMFHAFEVEGIEKVGEHDVIDLKILPDRASYCLSHRGIAREIASITGVPLTYDPLQSTERLPTFEDITVAIEDTHACTRFGAALVTGVTVGDSPQWLKDRLHALGARSINNIVDATNYVMYALGQPLHAYDAAKFPKVDGKWQFHVRFAQEGETVSLIAEKGADTDRVLSLIGTELLVVDASSNTPIGLAGIKGGAFAGVDEATTSIIIEAAHFDPIITRKTSRRLGIVIDGSKRFENNPSPELIPHALREVVLLIQKIASGTCVGAVDIEKEPVSQEVVVVNPQRVNALLGLSLSVSEITELIARVGATVTQEGELLHVVPPFERTDLHIEEDFIDEVGRLYGYKHVVSVLPEVVPLSEINARHVYSEAVRTQLVALGFSEVITSSFNKKDIVALRNALASDKSYMRSSLSANVNEVLDKNANLTDLLGAQDTRVFEIGTVFSEVNGVVSEHVSLCLGVRLKAHGYTPKDDAALREVVKTLESVLCTTLPLTIEGGVAECNFTQVLAALPKPSAYQSVRVAKELVYVPFSVYPAISRDIAMWVGESTLPEDIEQTLNESAGILRVRTTLVDVFSKDGRTSYAFRLVFQSREKTLTDDEVLAVMDGVYNAVRSKGWEIR